MQLFQFTSLCLNYHVKTAHNLRYTGGWQEYNENENISEGSCFNVWQ
jgi:hypothetical protein